MSDYARRHHPQVQARKVGSIPLNSFSREQYAAVLMARGMKTADLSKAALWQLVRETPGAMADVIARFSWRNGAQS